MRKILYITTIGITMRFFESFIKSQLDIGNQVDIATNENDGKDKVPTCYREWGCKVYHIDTSRSPIKFDNVRAIKHIRELVEDNQYDIVHCHTPIAAAVTRLACKSLRKNGVRVIYTAHGFHFYDGAPWKNWLMYYPVEKWLSKYTDVLITINKEDYRRAKEKFYTDKIEYVPGVGIDVNRFKENKTGRERIRCELGIDRNKIMLLSVGELNKNKNHENVIRAIKDIPNITYVIVGKGDLEERLRNIADKCNVDLRLIGYREDVADFYKAADVYILPSIREGLNVSLMEAMASGVPCCASNIRGNVDLLDSGLFSPKKLCEIKSAIIKLIETRKILKKNIDDRVNRLDSSVIERMIDNIYRECNR